MFWSVYICAGVYISFIKKETLTQVFSCEFCEIFQNTFSYRTPRMAAPGYPKRIYAYSYLFNVVHDCIIYHHNLGYLSMWLYQHQKMGKYHCSLKFTDKKRTPEVSTSIFLDNFWKLHSFFNHPYSWILQIIAALLSPQEIPYPQPACGSFGYNHQK